MTQGYGFLARWIAVIGLGVVLAACGGGDDDDVDATQTPDAGPPAATATPLAAVPEPTIVTAGAPPDDPSAEVTYQVEAGDTLSVIAERFDTSVVAIQDANGLTGTNIFVGQELTIPSGGAGGGGTDGGGGESDGAGGGGGTGDANPSTYTVQSGDLASLIAERFNVTLEALAAENDVTIEELNNLFVGQILNIPPAN